MCNEEKNKNQSLLKDVFSNDPICTKCRNKFKVIEKNIQVSCLKTYCLMLYDESFQEAIIQYKECYDEVLSEIFLYPYQMKLKKKYKKAIFIPAPSSKEKIEERGFKHIEKIFKCLNIEIVDCFSKSTSVKQAHRNKNQRKTISEDIELIKIPPFNKRVVLIDDVCTTGNTLLAMQRLLHEQGIKCEACVLAVHPLLIKSENNRFFDKFLHHKKNILNKK